LALYTRFRNSELRLAALEREWSTARLAALRMQLSPHTLFNLLHTIRGYIEWDPKGAQSMVVQLADLLRRLLNAGERHRAHGAERADSLRAQYDCAGQAGRRGWHRAEQCPRTTGRPVGGARPACHRRNRR